MRQGKTEDGNLRVKGENFYRTAKKVKQLNIFKEGKPQRNAQGEITKAATFQSRDVPTAVVEPQRRWFQNTRVISQESLQAFWSAVAVQANDPYRVLLKTNKLPMSLIRDAPAETEHGIRKHRAKMVVETSPFSEVLRRKRVRLDVSTLTDLADDAGKSLGVYKDRLDQARLLSGNSAEQGVDGEVAREEEEPSLTTATEPVFSKGQSRRIWNELYRTIDSSDVILEVLDARDPIGTRCLAVEQYLKREAPHKHLVFVLNKVDLVPSSVAASWVKVLSRTAPTLAFRSSVTNAFGKGSLISLLRQFSTLHSNRKQISVGLVGYPNVGKSSLINALRGKRTCSVAPIPGQTRVWQYVTLMKRIFLIDCPGIVPPDQKASPEDVLLRGAIRTEKIENPAQYIPAVMARVKQNHLARTYAIQQWDDSTHFLEMLARKRGRLLAGGEADVDGTARIVLDDMLRGNLPWYTSPPAIEGDEGKGIEGRAGRLGEMPRKRKRDDIDSTPDTSIRAPATPRMEKDGEAPPNDGEDKDSEEFEGFGSDSEPELDSEEESVDAEDMIALGTSSDEED